MCISIRTYTTHVQHTHTSCIVRMYLFTYTCMYILMCTYVYVFIIVLGYLLSLYAIEQLANNITPIKSYFLQLYLITK